ncbi:hypothetical protein SNE40_020031 [Patella caerulea]|uniref:Uncharacterized protein n=1 Tax=Patella caerulea TaxID=87958 RepID=A0AAN8J4J7_PATCE
MRKLYTFIVLFFSDVSKNTEKADFIKNPVSENLTLLFQNKYSNNIPGLSQTQHDENTDSCNSHSNDSKSKSKLKSKKHSSSSSEDSSSDSSSDLENNESSSTVKTSSDESSQSAEKLRTERKASPPHFKKKNRHDSSKSLNKQNKRDNRKHGFEASSRKDEIKDTKQSSHKHGYGSDDTKHRIRKYDYDTDGYKDRRSKDKNLDKEKIRSGEYISKRGMSKDRYRSRSRSRGKHHKSYDYKRYKHEDLQNRIVDKKFSKKNPTYVDEASCSKSKSRKRNHSRSLSEDDEYSKYHRRSSKDCEPRSRRKSGRSKYEDSDQAHIEDDLSYNSHVHEM